MPCSNWLISGRYGFGGNPGKVRTTSNSIPALCPAMFCTSHLKLYSVQCCNSCSGHDPEREPSSDTMSMLNVPSICLCSDDGASKHSFHPKPCTLPSAWNSIFEYFMISTPIGPVVPSYCTPFILTKSLPASVSKLVDLTRPSCITVMVQLSYAPYAKGKDGLVTQSGPLKEHRSPAATTNADARPEP